MKELVVFGAVAGGLYLVSRSHSSSSSPPPPASSPPSEGVAVPAPSDTVSGPVKVGRSDPGCSCSQDALGKPPRANAKSYTVQLLPELREKARIFPDTGFIQVAGPWWQGLADVQRMAVLAHELAHDEDMSACEECADARAGAILRYEGVGLREARSALASVVSTRHTTAGNVERGWKAADAAIREKGVTSSGLKGPSASSPTSSWPVPSGRPPVYALELYPRHLENDADQTSEGSPSTGAGDDIELGSVDPDLATSIGTPSGGNPQPVTGGQLVPKGNAGATKPSSSKPPARSGKLETHTLATGALILGAVVVGLALLGRKTA